MRKLLILLVQITAYLTYGKELVYRSKDGQYIIGAILPLTKIGPDGKCSQMNAEGVAVAEAIAIAIKRINDTAGGFKELVQKTTLGYDIRDNCGKTTNTEYVAFSMAREKMLYDQKRSKTTPVSVVISEFTMKDVKILPVLATKDIPQVSYSKDNARLKNNGHIDPFAMRQLISMYPGSNKRILAAVDVIALYQFGYVYAVADGNVEGRKAMKLLSDKLSRKKICKSEDMYASTTADVGKVLNKIEKNLKIRVVVLHCAKAVEVEFFKEAGKRNMSNLIIISTQNWDSDIHTINKYEDVVEGMIYAQYSRQDTFLKEQFQAKVLPFRDSPWLKSFFVDIGGNVTCFKDENPCIAKEKEMIRLLLKYEPVAIHALEGVYAIANILQEAQKRKTSFMVAAKGLKIFIPKMRGKRIVVSNDLSTEIYRFSIMNVQRKNNGNITTTLIAEWNENNNGKALTDVTNKKVKWKDGSIETPVSECSNSCPPGFSRSFLNPQRRCCWTCAKCPNGTASNVTNCDKCMPCAEGYVVRPQQTGCKKYTLLYFNWYGPVGIILIILMIITIVLIVLALGIFSNNNMHELVLHANYNSLTFLLFACILLVISPIPLLITPTESSCVGYMVLVNVAISMALGILLSRSAYIKGFFDENGELVKGTLGRFPKTLVVLTAVILQIIVNIVAYNMERVKIMHNHTERWDHRYHECSSWASITFWAGFSFNILISVVGNSMSCTSTQMEKDQWELKHVLQSHLIFYMVALTELCVFFRSNDEHLAGGQGVICILYALGFYFTYIAPKVYVIMFRSIDNKVIEKEVDSDEEGGLMTTALHASAGFKHHGIVQMKVRDED